MEPTDPDTPLSDDTDALRDRVRALEAEIARRDAADAAAQSRRGKVATFAGEVAVGAVAGSDVKRRGRNFWDAWRTFGQRPREAPFPEEETRELAVSVLARLTRVRLVYVLAAAIPSVFILAQTVLLSQQNARIDRQNNLMAFEQTTALREFLFIPPYDSLGQVVRDYNLIPDSLLYADSLYTWPHPNASSVAQILAFAQNEPDIVVPALRPLLRDRASSVAAGALQILSDQSLKAHVDSISVPGILFPGAKLSGANLDGADLSGADLSGADLSGADLSGADLSHADLTEARLSEASLRRANLNATLLSKAYLGRSDLSEAYLSGADLSGAYLRRADLSEAYLRRANLSDANLSDANLSGADLSEARLNEAYLGGADLGGADLSGAGLSGADLSGADLRRADLSAAYIGGTNLYRADLRHTNIFCVQNAARDFEALARARGATWNDSLLTTLKSHCPETPPVSE